MRDCFACSKSACLLVAVLGVFTLVSAFTGAEIEDREFLPCGSILRRRPLKLTVREDLNEPSNIGSDSLVSRRIAATEVNTGIIDFILSQKTRDGIG